MRDSWRKKGYYSVDSDLKEAFAAISKDVNACKGNVVPRFSSVIGGYQLFKYRHKNRAAREGASGGWRIYALFDKQERILYPIIVFPKKEMGDCDPEEVVKCVKELLLVLRQPPLDSN